MQFKLKIIPFIFCMAILNGCANSGGYSKSAKNQFVTEFYARVENVEKIKFKSYAGEGMAVGAAGGVLEGASGNSGDIFRGAIVGAFVGGILTAIFEGSTTGYQYQLHAVDGDVVSVIVGKKSGNMGDCVAVVVAGEIDMAKTSMAMCEEAEKEYPDFQSIKKENAS